MDRRCGHPISPSPPRPSVSSSHAYAHAREEAASPVRTHQAEREEEVALPASPSPPTPSVIGPCRRRRQRPSKPGHPGPWTKPRPGDLNPGPIRTHLRTQGRPPTNVTPSPDSRRNGISRTHPFRYTPKHPYPVSTCAIWKGTLRFLTYTIQSERTGAMTSTVLRPASSASLAK